MLQLFQVSGKLSSLHELTTQQKHKA